MITCEPRVRSDAEALVEEIANTLHQSQAALFHDSFTATPPIPEGAPPFRPSRAGTGTTGASESAEQAAAGRQEHGVAA